MVTGIAQKRRRRNELSIPIARAPSAKQLGFTAVFLLAFFAFATMAVLSHRHGVPDIGDTGLLNARSRYTFSDHGIQRDGERWRFVTIGLIFNTLWFGGVSAAAAHIFFPRTPPSVQRDDA